ncbi:hypothetical protein [Yoonia sp. MH D7]
MFSVDFGDDDETDSEEGDENPTPEGGNNYLQFATEDDVAAGSGSHIELEGVPIMYLVGVTAAQAQAADITLVPS